MNVAGGNGQNGHSDAARPKFWIRGLAVGEPQHRDDANRLIELIGSARREQARLQTTLNETVALAKAHHENLAADPREAEQRCTKLLKDWCKANRRELTGGDEKRKSVVFPAGMVRWRKDPPSVKLPKKKMIETFLLWLHEHRLARFIRTKEEVDREAMLAERDTLDIDFPGFGINPGGEKFVVEPVALELAPAAEETE